jgi:hypothetical protein
VLAILFGLLTFGAAFAAYWGFAGLDPSGDSRRAPFLVLIPMLVLAVDAHLILSFRQPTPGVARALRLTAIILVLTFVSIAAAAVYLLAVSAVPAENF